MQSTMEPQKPGVSRAMPGTKTGPHRKARTQLGFDAGIKSRDGSDTIEWQCGARNVDLELLPEECSI